MENHHFCRDFCYHSTRFSNLASRSFLNTTQYLGLVLSFVSLSSSSFPVHLPLGFYYVGFRIYSPHLLIRIVIHLAIKMILLEVMYYHA
ncbi:hypothetical protein BC941DRAFT_441391, partial [Chlamydoabsidia padenii]